MFAVGAGAAANRNGLTSVGRALQKHSVREHTVFTTTSTRFTDANTDAQNILDDILAAPGGNIVEVKDGHGDE